MSSYDEFLDDLDKHTADAVQSFWSGRDSALEAQIAAGKSDQGNRGTATSGRHFDSFIALFEKALLEAGVPKSSIFTKGDNIVIPGFYRATKQWDLVVVHQKQLLVVIETKSIVSSYGNNSNNRAEEALGSATDLHRAHEDEAFGSANPAWLGYLFLIADEASSRSTVRVREPHFKVLSEFRGSSYVDRAHQLCRKLVAERKYNAAAFMTSKKADKSFVEPDPDLTIRHFVMDMCGHVRARL